jgi:hypothetical protein
MNLWGEEILAENFLIPSWFRTADSWITVPWSYPPDHEGFVERKNLELPDIVCGREVWTDDTVCSRRILTENIISQNPWILWPRIYIKYVSLDSTAVGLEPPIMFDSLS